MQVSPNFKIQEFVYPTLWNQFKEKSIWFVDKRIIDIAQFIRTGLNRACTINNWHTGGSFRESGLRPFNSTVGASMSQHKYGKAIDLKVSGKTPGEVLQFVKNNWSELSKLGLTTYEATSHTPTWLHLDTRYTGLTELLEVKP